MTTHFLKLEQAIMAAINTQPCIGLVILFGSLAAGEGHAESDLGLAVDAGRPLTAGEKIDITSAP